MEKLIYLDNAATTKTRPEVVEAIHFHQKAKKQLPMQERLLQSL